MESLKNKIYDTYSTPPSASVVLVGLGIGALRIATANVFLIPFLVLKRFFPLHKNLALLWLFPLQQL